MNKYNNHDDIPGNPSVAKTSEVKLRTNANKDSLRVLSIDQWNFWKENGYVVIKNAISKKQAAKTASFLWEFEEKDPNDKSTRYTNENLQRGQHFGKSTWYTWYTSLKSSRSSIIFAKVHGTHGTQRKISREANILAKVHGTRGTQA